MQPSSVKQNALADLTLVTYLTLVTQIFHTAFPGSSVVKNLPASAGATEDIGSVPGSGRSPGEGDGNPVQYSCQDNPMDRGAWLATVHWVWRVRHDWARACTHTHTHTFLHTHTHTHTFLTSSRKDVSAKRDHVFSMFSSTREEGDPTKKGSLHISCLPNISPDDPSYPSILCMQ